MNSLWLLTKKNLQLLLRSRSSALIVIFAPLLLILIIGLSYNTSAQYDLYIGVHAPSFSEDVNSFIGLLDEEFTISKYESSVESCVEDMKRGIVHTCISLPETLNVQDNSQKEITFYIDQSKINLVWMIQETVKSKFDLQSKQISQDLSQNLLSKLSETKKTINEKKGDLTLIKDKNNAASTAASDAKISLLTINTNTTEIVYDTSLVNTVSSSIETVKDNIANALININALNLSSTNKTNITTPLYDANSTINSAISSLNGNGTSISSLINTIELDMQVLKNQISNISSSLATSTSNIDSSSTNLAESITSIDSLLESLNALSTTLDSLQVTDAAIIANPLTTKIETVREDNTFLNYLFPTLLILVVMFSSLLLGTTLVMMEKNSPAFIRNFFLPIKKSTFVLSIYLTNVILILIQVVILLAISLFFLKEVLTTLPIIAIILFISASVFTFLGMVVGYLFTSEETGVLASVSLGSLMLILSGTILPLEVVSSPLRWLTLFNPFVISEKLIRDVFFFNASISVIFLDLLLLFFYMVALFCIILIIETLLHKHLAKKFLKHRHKLHIQKDKMKKSVVGK